MMASGIWPSSRTVWTTLGHGATAVISEAVRVVRNGGRVVVIERVSWSGLFGLFRTLKCRSRQSKDDRGVIRCGASRRRLLVEVEGVRYFEGTKLI